MLIKLGAHINKRDYAKMTPIFYTVKYHHKQCLRALIEAGANLEVSKANGDTLIHEAAIYDSADCLIELAQNGLAINVKNNLQRTPLSLAEKKKSKYAYQALLNLEKAITMTNAFVERKYGNKDPENIKGLKLKSSLKKFKDQSSPKKKVRIAGDEGDSLNQDEISKENQERTPDKNEVLERLNKLASLRNSLRSSTGSGADFTKYATKALKNNKIDQDVLLKEILEYEKEEIKNVEEILRQSEIEKEKEKKIEEYGQKEKMRRWQVIEQKREQQLLNIQQAKDRDIDPFKVAQQLEEEQQQKEEDFQEIELSSVTDEEEKERRRAERAQEGQFPTFKNFMDNKYKDNPMNNYLSREKTKSASPQIETPSISSQVRKKRVIMIQEPKHESLAEIQEEEEPKEETKQPVELEEEESEVEEELDFKDQNRSFEQHPLGEQHNSDISENEEIRMSKSTLRQIKVKVKNRSVGPPGRSSVYVDANSSASKGMKKLTNLWKKFKDFLSKRYENVKGWITAEEEVKKKRAKSKPLKRRKLSEEYEERIGRKEMIFEPERRLSKSKERDPSSRNTMGVILERQRTYGKTAAELIFEPNSSSMAEEAPSVIFRRKISKLKEEERKLKQIEKQIAQDFKELEGDVPKEKLEEFKQEFSNRIKPKKKRKGRRKKKVHHDMKKMKKKHIQNIMNQDITSSENEPKKQFFVKDFKSDNESYIKQGNKNKLTGEKNDEGVKAEEIVIEPLNEDIVQIGVEEVKEVEDDFKLSAPVNSVPSPKPPNSPQIAKAILNNDNSKFTLESKTPKIEKKLDDPQNTKNTLLNLKEYSDHSNCSENIRYKSVERPRSFFQNLALPEFTKKYSGSKYSLSHHSENNSNKSDELKKPTHMHSVGSIEKVPAFELRNVKRDVGGS